MGIAVSKDRLAIGTRRQIYFLNPALQFAPRIEPAGSHDRCWLTRSSFVTGSVHGHDLAWGEEGLWVVNTLFSCLCTLNSEHNFVPRWRPPFISQLIDQDRCHVNGLAMEAGRPRYVTEVNGITFFVAGSGNTTLIGGLGDDKLKGGAGKDWLDGGEGNDDERGESERTASLGHIALNERRGLARLHGLFILKYL